MVAPMPFDAPVTTATLPFKSLIELLLAAAPVPSCDNCRSMNGGKYRKGKSAALHASDEQSRWLMSGNRGKSRRRAEGPRLPLDGAVPTDRRGSNAPTLALSLRWPCSHTPVAWGLRELYPSGRFPPIGQDARQTGSS